MSGTTKDYKKLAVEILKHIGGKENIISATRCATRLRLVLKDTPENAENEIKNLAGVITVVQRQGQFQIVIGAHVGEVFEVIGKELNLSEENSEKTKKEDNKNLKNTELAKTERKSILNIMLQTMSGVFAPICYLLAAAGLFQGVLILISMAVPSIRESGAFKIFDLITWTPFIFLPILIAVSAAKYFNCNTFTAVTCCLALVSPTWTELASQIAQGESIKFLFIPLTKITYTSSVLPSIILVALLGALERFLNKHLPEIIKSLFTPLISLVIVVPLTLVVIGPIIQGISNEVADIYNILYSTAPSIAGALVGGLWQVIVLFGVHWGIVPIVIANFAANGYDTIQIFIQIAVISQMAAAFGVFLKSKDKEIKTAALSAGITAIFGITEPTIYGITLPRKKPFIYACIWAGIGSVVAALIGAVQYVYAGLPGLLSTVNSISPENPASFTGCIVGTFIAAAGTIITIMIFGCESKNKI